MKYVEQVINETLRIWPPALTFSEENVSSISKIAFQPFGMGPRNCVGMRHALFEIAYTIVKMTQHFRWELGDSQLAMLNPKGLLQPTLQFNRVDHGSEKDCIVLVLSRLCALTITT
ncbi:hypothetical protein HPB47_022752 [Ixodes persulcatus]|uniref:Uncharacterized protein n=1 Tax=Ixodes persulcatus TaxID=34615 RepID=A0AC60QC72_IXOPE|nr:hypothetical protein HPB47_022752 [Ixodes persulcatus]